MATSGSVDFSVTRNELIETAMKHGGILAEGQTPSSTQYTEGAILLNMLVKARQVDGMPLWALARGYLLPISNVSTLAFSGSHIVSSYNHTTTSAAASSGATTIVVTATTGFADTRVIGVELEDGTMQWTTQSGAVSGSTITLAAALTDDVSSGADVYVYNTTSRITFPKRVLHANRYTPSAGTSSPITLMAREQYYELGNRESESTPSQLYFEPGMTPALFWYPRFSNGDSIIEFTYHKSYEDFDASSDTPDFPQEWYLPIMMELAYLLASKYGVALDERKSMLQEATMYREMALSNNYPESSIYLMAD